ncbi:hypothetical protein [Sideroxydans sp. CL21]|nr:hypothetical protein [Sideroxydans sp. CL21]
MHFPISNNQFTTHQDQFPPLTEGGDSTDENKNGQSKRIPTAKTRISSSSINPSLIVTLCNNCVTNSP